MQNDHTGTQNNYRRRRTITKGCKTTKRNKLTTKRCRTTTKRYNQLQITAKQLQANSKWQQRDAKQPQKMQIDCKIYKMALRRHKTTNHRDAKWTQYDYRTKHLVSLSVWVSSSYEVGGVGGFQMSVPSGLLSHNPSMIAAKPQWAEMRMLK